MSAHCPLFTVHCPLSTAYCSLPTVQCQPSSVYCPLSTVYCPTVPCPLFNAHCLLPSVCTALCPLYFCPLLSNANISAIRNQIWNWFMNKTTGQKSRATVPSELKGVGFLSVQDIKGILLAPQWGRVPSVPRTSKKMVHIPRDSDWRGKILLYLWSRFPWC
jgi:hypothetical protein